MYRSIQISDKSTDAGVLGSLIPPENVCQEQYCLRDAHSDPDTEDRTDNSDPE